MNWHMTRSGTVRWRKNEPFCTVFPVPKNALETVEPEIHALESNEQLHAEYKAWRQKRDEFMARFRAKDEETLKEAWQRYYFTGTYPNEPDKSVTDHRQKVRLAAPVDKRLPSK
jgi:hypothetical protein